MAYDTVKNGHMYGNGSNNSYFTIGGLTVYFSYQTPIAFSYKGIITIRKNEWVPTTGKHLNAIDGNKDIRISGDEFIQALDRVITDMGI